VELGNAFAGRRVARLHTDGIRQDVLVGYVLTHAQTLIAQYQAHNAPSCHTTLRGKLVWLTSVTFQRDGEINVRIPISGSSSSAPNLAAKASPERVTEAWHSEKRSAYLYRALAAIETGTPRARMFAALSNAAEAQAKIWFSSHGTANNESLHYSPAMREKIVLWLARRLGPRSVRPALAALKVRGLSALSTQSIAKAIHPAPVAGKAETSHRGLASGGNLRAAIFGINDGLLSNASLILGVAGAAVEPKTILITGIAGLAAGAFSMAAGEFVSVSSQRELFERQIALEREELVTYPDEEAKELSLIYQARGVPAEEADAFAQRLIADPEHALDTLAREELGLNPDELGSAWGAALSSFAAFAFGGALPLLPFVLPLPGTPLIACMAITAIALFAVGATLSLFTGRNGFFSGARMLLIGGLACATTFLIGKWFGVAVG
jgi:vacuolar iron transporter family protein